MKRIILIIVLSFLSLVSIYATSVEIGDGTETTIYMPTYGFYNYSWSNYILTAYQIGQSINIEEVQFQVSNEPSNYEMMNQQLYLKHTSESEVSSAYPDPANNGFTLVFDGNVLWDGSGWQGIILDDSFTYDGVSNLQFVWINQDGVYEVGYPKFLRTNAETSVGAYSYADGAFPTTDGTSVTYFPNTKLIHTDLYSVFPASDAEYIELTPTISFEVADDYFYYQVYFGDSPNPATEITPFSPVAGPVSYSFTEPLDDYTDYYWVVALYDFNYQVTTLNFKFRTRPSFEGFGTEENPYQILNIADLLTISENESLWDKYFVQLADIDASVTAELNAGTGFSPIGTSYTNSFSGSYNGYGYKIYDLYINRASTNNVGLFGYAVGANISNISLVNSEIAGYDDVGSLVGYLSGSSIMGNTYATGSVSGHSYVGALVGSSFSDINNSYARGSVTAISGYVGGLVGYSASSATISNCYSTGSVIGANNFGGLVGVGTSSAITNSFWDIETSGQETSPAGIGKTTEEMKDRYTFLTKGWDFVGESENGREEIWYIHPSINAGYPYLSATEYGDFDSVPNYAVLVYPNDGMTNMACADNLIWDIDYTELTSGYKLNLGTDNPPSNLVNNQEFTWENYYNYSDLEEFTSYYWQVIPYNYQGDAENCPVWSFTTGSAKITNVGSEWDSTEPLPIDPGYTRSYSQSIYLQSELNLANRNIENIAFYVTGLYDFSGSNQWKVYLGQTDQAEFTDANDWLLASDGLTEVANITFDNNLAIGWLDIELNTPFTCNDTDNLVVGVIEYSATPSSAIDFFTVETQVNRSITLGNDSITPTTNIPYAGILSTSIPKINFTSNVNPTIDLPSSFTFAEDNQLIVDMSQYINDIDDDQLSLSVTYDESSSVNINADINDLLVTFSATTNWYGSENLVFTVTDENNRSAVFSTVEIIVTPVNDAPTIELPTSLTFAEDNGLILDMSDYINDIDGNPLTITVSGGENIHSEISGLMVLLSSTENWFGTEEITFTVDDNITRNSKSLTRATVSNTVDIIVTPVNDTPMITLPAYFVFAEDGELEIDMSQYVYDIDEDSLTLSISDNEMIQAEINDLVVTLSAMPDWFGTETITVTVNDNNGRALASTTTEILVASVNDAPTIELPASFTFAEDEELILDMSQYITDIDEDELTLSVSGNELIQVNISEFMVTFTVMPDWSGTEEVTFTVDDNILRNTKDITRATASNTVEIIVTPVNDIPTIELPVSFTFAEDGELVVDMSQYTSDIDEDQLTLSVDSSEMVQADISELIVTFSASPDWFGSENLTFYVNDNNSRAIASANTNIIVTPVNDIPTIELPASFTFAEDEELILDMSQYITDIDEDELTLSVSGNELIQVNISEFMVTFTAMPDWSGTEEVTFTVDDNILRNTKDITRATASNTVEIIVTPVNDIPTIELPESFTFAEDGELIVDMSQYVYDIDEDQLAISISDSEMIQAEINELTVTFSSMPDWFGTETITVNVNDNNNRVLASTSTEIIVTSVNDAPTIELPESFTFAEDGELIVDMSQYIADIDEDELTLTVSGNELIQTDISGLVVTLSAMPDWSGTEEVTFTVDDNILRNTKGISRATASSSTNIIVTPVNDAPTIDLPASFTFIEDGELIVDMNQYVYDIDEDVLTLTITGQENITAMVNAMEVTFGSVENWFGDEQITVTVNDNNGRALASATTEITVISVNDGATIILPISFTFAEDASLIIDVNDYITNIEESPLTLTISGNELVQTEINDMLVTLTATMDWYGSEELTFTIDDNNRTLASSTTNIIVTPVNDAPTIELPTSFTFAEDGQLVVDMTQYISDVDEDELTLTVTGNEVIQAVISGLVVTFSATQDWYGTEELIFTVNDNNNRAIASSTTNIIVTSVNDVPTIELPATFTFAEDGQLVVDMTQYTADLDNDTLTLTVSGNEMVQADISDLIVTFSATPDWYGNEELTFTINDNNNRAIVSSTTSIIVTSVNDAPTIDLPAAFIFAEDEELIVDISQYIVDIDEDELTLEVTGYTNINVLISGMELSFSAVENWHGAELITVTVNDNNNRAIATSTSNIIVTSVNDAPTIELPISFTFAEDGELIVDMTQYTADLDNDVLTLTVLGNEMIQTDISGLVVTFSAITDWSGAEELTFTINDNNNRAIASDTSNIIVTSVNDAPTIELAASFTFAEDGQLIVDISEFIEDLDNDELTLEVTGQTNINVAINNMELTMTALENWFGTEELTFTVNDNNRALASATSNIIVTSVNDAPTIVLPNTITFAEDDELIINMSLFVADIDEDPLTISVTGTQNTIVEFNDLVVTLSALPDWNGSEELTFTVDDGVVDQVSKARASSSITTTVVVTPVNDAPTIELPASFTFAEDEELVVDISLYISDIDEDALTFVVTGQENITGSISGTEITIGSLDNWYGTEEITVTIDDGYGRTIASDATEIIVTAVNDQPIIYDFSPDESEINSQLNAELSFSIVAEDIDSDLIYRWYVNDVDQEHSTSEFAYSFMESMTYQIKAIVSDEEYSVEHLWTVIIPVANDNNEITPLVTGIISNYPNPFNPDTTIKFSLEKESWVNINIYDLKGKVVRKLHDAYENSGLHNISWDGLNDQNKAVASGIYYVRMNSVEGIHTRKITLMK